jgi:hypothetical protein
MGSLQNNQSELGNTPEYNYVMVDTDFLLLPVLADYFLNYPQGRNRSTEFFARNSTLNQGTFEELLIKNVDHVLNLSMPFALNATQENLVQIRDPLVGNWRDSGTGLGYGIYPFDVNCEPQLFLSVGEKLMGRCIGTVGSSSDRPAR